MTLDDAKRQYPGAWAEVQRQIAEFQAASDAEVFPTGVHLLIEHGIELLQIDTVTDLVPTGTDAVSSRMGFRAPVRAPTPGRGAAALH